MKISAYSNNKADSWRVIILMSLTGGSVNLTHLGGIIAFTPSLLEGRGMG